MSREGIIVDLGSDWHIGINQPEKGYPTDEKIIRSLERSLLDGSIVVLTGDTVDKGTVENAFHAGALFKPFTERGLKIVDIDGNHTSVNGKEDEVRRILRQSGVIYLENQIYPIRNGKTELDVVAVSGELVKEPSGWWAHPDMEVREATRRKIRKDAQIQNDVVLTSLLEQTTALHILFITHRGISPQTVDEGYPINPRVEGFGEILSDFTRRRRGVNVVAVHGHHHSQISHTEGHIGNIPVYNVAASIQPGPHLMRRITFV